MSKEIYEWDVVAIQNALFVPADGGWPEGMTRSDVNNAARENLASQRRQYNDPEWIVVRIQGPEAADIGIFGNPSTTTFTINLTGVDLTGYFTDGRIVKIVNGSGAGVDLITQCEGDAVYNGTHLTTVTVPATTPIDPLASDAMTYFSSVARGLSLADSDTDFYIPATADDIGIQGAVTSAEAAGGGTVLLIHSSYLFTNAVTITSSGPIVFMGAKPGTQITAATGSTMNELFLLNSVTYVAKFMNINFNANIIQRVSGNNDCVRIQSALAPTFLDCQFSFCRIAINIEDVNCQAISIVRCLFTEFTTFAITGTSESDTMDGTVADCKIFGDGVVTAGAAGIKVSGRWNIDRNDFSVMGHATDLNPAIWIWNKTGTSPENGGYRTRATNNVIDCSNAVNGIGIEIGASRCTAEGNVIKLAATTGTGIHVISRTGGQFMEGCVVNGNTIEGGALGISVNDLVRESTINSNSVNVGAGGIGIELDGSKVLTVSGNNVSGGAIGVDVGGAAQSVSVIGNTLDSQTADGVNVNGTANGTRVMSNVVLGSPVLGANVLVAAIDTQVKDNDFTDAATPWANASDTTRGSRNSSSDVQAASYSDADTDNWAALPGGIVPIVDIQNKTWGQNMFGNAKGTYMIRYELVNNSGVGDTAVMRLFSGPTGDQTDTNFHDSVGVTDSGGTWQELGIVHTVTNATDRFSASVYATLISGGTQNFVVRSLTVERIGE